MPRQLVASSPAQKAGNKFDASVIVRGVEAEAASWKAAVKTLAADTAKRFEAGEIHF